MKIIFLGIAGLMGLAAEVSGQGNALQRDTTTVFRVEGLCDMCQERIESSFKRKGVYAAHWNVGTKLLEVRFDPQMVSVEKLHQWVSDAGHDTELRKARKAAYDALPECCHLRRFGTVMLLA